MLAAVPKATDDSKLPAIVDAGTREQCAAIVPYANQAVMQAPLPMLQPWLAALAAITSHPESGKPPERAKAIMAKVRLMESVIYLPACLVADDESSRYLMQTVIRELAARKLDDPSFFPSAPLLQRVIDQQAVDVLRIHERLHRLANLPTEDEARAALPAWMHDQAKKDPVMRLRIKWGFRFPRLTDSWERICFDYVREHGEATVDLWHEQMAAEGWDTEHEISWFLRKKHQVALDARIAAAPEANSR